MATIDWTSLGTACNRHHTQRHFMVKLSHDLLPTRERTKKYDNKSPTHCIYCNDTDENRDHLMRCNHETCTTWRAKLLRTIRTQGEPLQTDPVLLSIPIDNLHSWLIINPTPKLQHIQPLTGDSCASKRLWDGVSCSMDVGPPNEQDYRTDT
jgi:hypothetical protein